MAKKVYHNGEFAHYEEGVIYDLGFIDPRNNQRHIFYVGESHNPAQRLIDHKRAGKNATEESTLVYQAIKKLDDAGIKWNMYVLEEYGQEGPTDLEDEWIMRRLYSGWKLKNMKKGNANWMAEREAAAADMRVREISSYRKYKEILSQEEKQAEADRKHAEWMRKEAEQTEKEKAQARAAIVRQELEEQMRKDREAALVTQSVHEQRVAKIKADAAARWEADRPAREARLRAEAEAKQAKENAKQAAIQARIEEQKRKEKEPLEAQIKIMQGLVLTYQQYGCKEEVLQTAQERLHELIELAK